MTQELDGLTPPNSRTRKMRDWSHTHREPRVDARWSSWLLTCRKDRAGTRQVRYFWSFVEPDGARARVQHTEARLAHLTHELDERLVFGGLHTKSRRADVGGRHTRASAVRFRPRRYFPSRVVRAGNELSSRARASVGRAGSSVHGPAMATHMMTAASTRVNATPTTAGTRGTRAPTRAAAANPRLTNVAPRQTRHQGAKQAKPPSRSLVRRNVASRGSKNDEGTDADDKERPKPEASSRAPGQHAPARARHRHRQGV
jgi:hypothetical protein